MASESEAKPVPHFRVGDEVRVLVGVDRGRRGLVKIVSERYIAGQGQLIKIHLNGETLFRDTGEPWYPTYCGASLRKLEK